MDVICHPSRLQGEINAIPSKSDAHRKLICAALSDRPSVLKISTPYCDDIAATIRCLETLGAKFGQSADGLHITPIKGQNICKHVVLDCGESGSTFRFLLPVAAALCDSAEFRGSGRLPNRPISELAKAMEQHGVTFSSYHLPFSISGKLGGGSYEIAGNISSQYLTGLLLALPLCSENSKIIVTTSLQSLPYVEMTLASLYQSKISIEKNEYREFVIAGNQKYHVDPVIQMECDWSNAAFWLGANAIGNQICLNNLSMDSKQGDKEISSILHDFSDLNSDVTVDMEQIPDLLPILAVCASFRNAKTQFVNASRLRLKESDRIASVAAMLRALGGNVEEFSDSMCVYGCDLTGGPVDSCGDHRIAMSAAIAAVGCKKDVIIHGAECVKKSYPRFFKDYQMLGGKCDVVDIW